MLSWSPEDRRLTTVSGLHWRTIGDLSGVSCYEGPRPGGAWLTKCGEALRGPRVATGPESGVCCGLEVLSWSPEDLETDQSLGLPLKPGALTCVGRPVGTLETIPLTAGCGLGQSDLPA